MRRAREYACAFWKAMTMKSSGGSGISEVKGWTTYPLLASRAAGSKVTGRDM